jgi:hypothetical protein
VVLLLLLLGDLAVEVLLVMAEMMVLLVAEVDHSSMVLQEVLLVVLQVLKQLVDLVQVVKVVALGAAAAAAAGLVDKVDLLLAAADLLTMVSLK